MTGARLVAERDRQNRQSIGEHRTRHLRRGNNDDRDLKTKLVRQPAQTVRIVQRDETRRSIATQLPGAQREFATDPGWITHGECEWAHSLDMQRPTVHCQRGLLHRLVQAGVSVAGACDILG